MAGEEGKRDRKKSLPASLTLCFGSCARVLQVQRYFFPRKTKVFFAKESGRGSEGNKNMDKKAPAAAAVTLEEEEEKQKRRRRDQGMIA